LADWITCEQQFLRRKEGRRWHDRRRSSPTRCDAGIRAHDINFGADEMTLKHKAAILPGNQQRS
jgi:hypothetical protein